MLIRARAPLRISFAGGGTDVSPYCEQKGGAVLSATINRYAFATVEPHSNSSVTIRSLDYNIDVSFDLSDPLVFDGQLDLAKGVIEYFRSIGRLNRGGEIFLHNDAPPGSGLGSSSALTVALLKALSEYTSYPIDSYDIAKLAYQIERIDVGIKGGKQDQYACAFGGINFIEFEADSTVVNPLRIKPEIINELEYSLIFAYVGGSHFSSHIIEKQTANVRNGKEETMTALDTLKRLAYESKKALLLGNLRSFGELLDVAWQAKRRLTEDISNARIDEIYEEARKAGALGGKITGAGGGGFMFFCCDPRKRFSVQESLKRMGAEIVEFSFTMEGVHSWTVNT